MFIGHVVSVILMEDSDDYSVLLSLGSHVHGTKHYLMGLRPKIVTLGVFSSLLLFRVLVAQPWW